MSEDTAYIVRSNGTYEAFAYEDGRRYFISSDWDLWLLSDKLKLYGYDKIVVLEN